MRGIVSIAVGTFNTAIVLIPPRSLVASAPVVTTVGTSPRLEFSTGRALEISVLVGVPQSYVFGENPVELGYQLALEGFFKHSVIRFPTVVASLWLLLFLKFRYHFKSRIKYATPIIIADDIAYITTESAITAAMPSIGTNIGTEAITQSLAVAFLIGSAKMSINCFISF